MFCRWASAILCVGLAGCASNPTLSTEVDDASGGWSWREQGGLFAKVRVTAAAGHEFEGQILYQVSTRRMVIQRLYDGALEQVGYGDGRRVWTRGVPIDDWDAWTQLLVYVSFLPAPLDLSRPGTTVRELAPLNHDGQTYRVGLITRSSQDDRWAICVSQADRLPRALIPLASNASATDGQASNHDRPLTSGYAVVYEQFSYHAAVALPTRWSVWNWNSRQGITGTGPVAVVEVSEPAFGGLDPSANPQINWSVFDISGRWWR